MRIAEIIGSVTLSRVHPTLSGIRLVIGVPFSLQGLRQDRPDGEDLVIVDALSAGMGQRIAFSEGVEAAAPYFPQKKPVDAYNAAILDQVNIQ